MNKELIPNLIKSLIPELKAQVAEQMKIQGAENATINLNVNVHTGDNHYVTVNLPKGINIRGIASTDITPEMANSIQYRTLEDLSAQQLESMPDSDAASAVVGSTLASMNTIISEST